MALRWSPINLVTPVLPDAHHCGGSYGTQLNHLDCNVAAGLFPTGATAVPYSIDFYRPDRLDPHNIPFQVSHGSCIVSLDIIGNEDIRGSVSIVPDVVRGLAGHVIAECVRPYGMGGFATGGLSNMIRYILSPQEYPYLASLAPPFPGNLHPFPQTALFFTVTVSGPSGLHQYPPAYDPAIPLMLAHGIGEVDVAPEHVSHAAYARQMLLRVALAGESPWFRGGGGEGMWDPSDKDEMTYECDSSLGSPRLVDCTHIEYSQLGAGSARVSVGTRDEKSFVENTCRVTVEASTTVVLIWDQIKIALDALINLCVGNPLKGARGGRAFYGVQSEAALEAAIIGRRKKKRRRKKGRRSAVVTGLNALPPNVTITISAG